MHLIGRQIGNYVIEERIGRGGMAAVYKAYQPGLDRHVAIKIMHGHLGDDEGFAERFQREARLMGRLQYPHIVRVFDAGTFHCTPEETPNGAAAPTKDGASSQIHCSSDTLYYLVLDYIEGGTLQDLLHSDTKLSIEQALDLTTQLADALVHMHDRGMMHRDIKPANILFADATHTHALLGDFGFARMIEQQAGQLTALGAIVGTPNYMSPEAVRGEPCDERSDVYSLGVVLYEILAGRAPYLANTPYSMMMKLNTEPLPPIREFNPAIPQVVEEILNRALAKEAANRFQNAAEFGDALLNARVALLSAAAAEASSSEEKSAKVKEAKRPKAPKPAPAPKPANGQPKRGLFMQRKGLTMVGSVSVVLLCAWFTIVALLILEKSVGAVGATPVTAASPIQLQTNLVLQANDSQSNTTQADILNGGIVPTATEVLVAEVAAPIIQPATATATSTPLTRLTPAESDVPLTGTIIVSPAVTTTLGEIYVDATAVDETTVDTSTVDTPAAAQPDNAIPAVGAPVVITPLPQE
ncbi:MAG: serine/threonine-protein kinase [Caldilineaceae bacterium]